MINKRERTIIIFLTIILILSLVLYDRVILTQSTNVVLYEVIDNRLSDVKSSLERIKYDLDEALKSSQWDLYLNDDMQSRFDEITFTTQDFCNIYFSIKGTSYNLDINNNTASISNEIGDSFRGLGRIKKLSEKDIQKFLLYKDIVNNWLKCFERVDKLNYSGLDNAFAILEELSIYSRGVEYQYFNHNIMLERN